MKNRFFLLVLLIFLILSFNSCSKNEQTNQQNKNSSKNSANEKTVPISDFINNKNVRLAFAYAIDKSYIENNLLNNGSKAADYFVNSNLCFDNEGNDFRNKYPDGFIHYDVDKAKEHWDKAKEELGFNKYSLKFLTFDLEDRKKVSEYVVSQLMKNLEGLSLELDVQPLKNKLQMGKEGKFEIELHSWGADYADPMTFLDLFISGIKANVPKYSNSKYDELVISSKSGELSKDAEKRYEALQEAEKILVNDDVAIIPLYEEGIAFLQRSGLKNLQKRNLPPEFYFENATTDILTNGKQIIRMPSNSDIPTTNSSKAGDSVSFTVLANTIDTLTTISPDNKIIFKAAESVDISEDNLTYTFHLRKNAKWQNGTPVTAKDFEFGFKTLADPKTGASYSFILETAGIVNATPVTKGEMDVNELGVKAIDDYTFEIKLSNPVPFLLSLLSFNSFSPINEDFYNIHKENYGTSIETTLCNGPYILNEWKIGYGYSLIKNENYWNKENVKNDGIDFRIIKEISAGVNMFENNELDYCKLSGEYVSGYLDNPNYDTQNSSRINYIRFNLNNR